MTNPNEIGVNDPEELGAAGAPASAEIAASTTLGPVHLTVSDLERWLAFYRDAVGLEVIARADGTGSVGVDGRELVVGVEEPGAGPGAGYTGLYHVALLLPQRADLARWLTHATRERVALTGMSDHFVSEALYLRDPDGHGIEIYWDRPRDAWEGLVESRMTTQPLDVGELMAEIGDPAADRFDGLPAGTIVGHVHLKVASIPETEAFYRDVLGFALMASLGAQATFLAAGGYHHHIGANVWESRGAPPPPAGTAALRYATVVLPDEAERESVLARVRDGGHEVTEDRDGPVVTDPSGNRLVLAVGSVDPVDGAAAPG
ncbi:MAG TPA: VOC family protein [Solirubrobacterales bacterium]|nr:VOC family protein [Solirubrobacterales bacterium]